MNELLDTRLNLQTAVLFLVFNRPDTTKQVFEAIRQAKPPRLYIAADGPRESRKGETEEVSQVRRIATSVDWPCEVKTLFHEKNLGCKTAVSGGIDWFFENEVQGIILEDDCLPHNDFFRYCEVMLNRYADDDRVWVVTGDNFQDGQKRGDASYYFSRYIHVWGWATWRRAWIKRDMEIKFWPEWKNSEKWNAWLPNKIERKYWKKIFDRMYGNEIDTWDYPWTASVWINGGLTVTPNVNLVSNIGFGPNATHTTSDSIMSNIKTSNLNKIIWKIFMNYCRVCFNKLGKSIFTGTIFKKSIDYFECSTCDYVQTEQPYWLENAYSTAINICDTGIMVRNQSNVGLILATLDSIKRNDGIVVDYAGGYGILVRLLRDRGVEALWSDAYCQNLLALGFEHSNENADLVTAFEAFEHFVSPLIETEKLFSIAPNLLISTNLVASPAPLPHQWWYYGLDHGQHIGFFRLKTLKFIAKKFGKHLFTDGRSCHLFTEVPISSMQWNLKVRIARRVPSLFSQRLKSKTWSDFQKMSKYK